MILSKQTIRRLLKSSIIPFFERTVHRGMTFGLGPASYDIRIAQDKFMWPWRFTLASSQEYIRIPNNIFVEIKDKSTWIRRGLHVHNTVADPGFFSHLTLELKNQKFSFFFIRAGDPICQLVFSFLDEETEAPYTGKYQDQGLNPVKAIFEKDYA